MKDIRNIEIQIGNIVAYPYQAYSSAGMQTRTGRVIKFNPKSVKVVVLDPDGSDKIYTAYRSGKETLEEQNIINPEKKICIIGIVE